MTRPVKIFETPAKTKLVGTGFFRGWGMGYEEFETGPGNYSTAIVENSKGEVSNVYVGCIQFTDIEPVLYGNRSPAEQACIDIYSDYMSVAVQSQSKSVQHAWKVGEGLVDG